VVVGAGPNGLSAAVELARAGHSTLVVEAEEGIGGGARTLELTRPGFRHDICSAILPMAAASPFFRMLDLEQHGLELVQPPAPLAHPLDGGAAVVLERSVEQTAAGLGVDAGTYRRMIEAPVASVGEALPRLFSSPRLPSQPLALGPLAWRGLHAAQPLAEKGFHGERARALFAGLAGHSNMSLRSPLTAAFGLGLAILGHAVGWPVARGGSQAIADALASLLRALGGEIVIGWRVESIEELPTARAYVLDLSPQQVLAIAGDRFPERYRRALARYRYGPAAFKLDWALDGPIPWAAPDCARAGTVHVGGTLPEIAQAEDEVARGGHPEMPLVLVAQQSLFDRTRAPEGKQVAWAYCHVPNGSRFDMTERVEAQIERFAPGFRDRVLDRATTAPADFERLNANHVGGDFAGGLNNVKQILFRPVARPVPYATPAGDVFLCSSSTPPGGGVHGICGYLAARVVTRRLRRGSRSA
jgi:phytoene dehydrogenase-like protein